jgi:hypothetical protein
MQAGGLDCVNLLGPQPCGRSVQGWHLRPLHRPERVRVSSRLAELGLTAILPQTNRLNSAHRPPKATSSPSTRSTSLESGPFSSSSTGAGEGVGTGPLCPPFVYDCSKFPADDNDVGNAEVVDEARDDSVI